MDQFKLLLPNMVSETPEPGQSDRWDEIRAQSNHLKLDQYLHLLNCLFKTAASVQILLLTGRLLL